eukprot:5235653-Prymnesium_polylepis.1
MSRGRCPELCGTCVARASVPAVGSLARGVTGKIARSQQSGASKVVETPARVHGVAMCRDRRLSRR